MAASLVLVLFLAGVMQGIQEKILGKYLSGWKMWGVSMAIGVGAALAFGAQLYGPVVSQISDSIRVPNLWVDQVLTGITLGFGSNGVHYVYGWLKSAKASNEATTAAATVADKTPT
jgi:hypothetical protein